VKENKDHDLEFSLNGPEHLILPLLSALHGPQLPFGDRQGLYVFVTKNTSLREFQAERNYLPSCILCGEEKRGTCEKDLP
jgi:hypothetical protein